MIISNVKIVLLDDVIIKGYIKITGKYITSVKAGKYLLDDDNIIDGNNFIVMPGFIDIHTHGSCGVDFMEANLEDFTTISNAFYKEGITSYLATTLTSDKESLLKVAKTVREAKSLNSSLLGLHLEGPYINPLFKGAQNENFIRKPNISELNEINNASNNNVRLITIAPELDLSNDFIKYAKSLNITVSAGHTNASFVEIEHAIKYGLTNITHTHNAMSKYDHKNPGVVTAALFFDNLYTECICDLIHVNSNTLKTFYKIVGPKRFMIVTDSLLAKHSLVNEFELFKKPCVVRNNAAYMLDGNLAGSILKMDEAVRNIKKLTNASLPDLARISSYNQAKCLNLNDRGEIIEGKLADLVLLDNNLNVVMVIKQGKVEFKNY